MKAIVSVIITCLFIFFSGCEKSDISNSELTGTWIEQAEKSDTIVFTTFASEQALNLRRGHEYINDYWLPKYGAGFWAWELSESDSIALRYSLSSSGSFKKYIFTRINENTFSIGNFYNPDKSTEALFTFSRIK